jgi:hypothetical protein
VYVHITVFLETVPGILFLQGFVGLEVVVESFPGGLFFVTFELHHPAN